MATKNIWAIGGGKGGVGKSFVAGNLGILLAKAVIKSSWPIWILVEQTCTPGLELTVPQKVFPISLAEKYSTFQNY